MIYRIILRKNAEAHINDIYNWYELQKKDWGMNSPFLLKPHYLQ